MAARLRAPTLKRDLLGLSWTPVKGANKYVLGAVGDQKLCNFQKVYEGE